MYILLDDNNYVIHPPSTVWSEGWVEVTEDIVNELSTAPFIDCCQYIDGVLIYDEAKHQAYIEDANKQNKEWEGKPSQQEQIEALQAENKELKEYVELISDSVVDLAMRTLKEG